MENKHTISELRQWQALPLNIKISMTQERIKYWVDEYGLDKVYVSFSGGKDSTVLLDICRKMYPDMKAAYVATGLEFPELQGFVHTFDNVDIIRPRMNFKKVIETYGYPMISKEVSESVYGAKKYLESILKQENAKTTTKRSEQKCMYCDNLLGKKGCLGMCNKHYIQYKRWGDPLHSDKKGRATIDGYFRDGKSGRREHRVIYEQYYGIKLKSEEVIHHINFVKTDNRIENLYKYDNASDHIKAHREYERLYENLADNEEIYFKDGCYLKRERERERNIPTDRPAV